MTGSLCLVCEQNSRCMDFGIPHALASRLMIAKSAHREEENFPIGIYRDELEREGLNTDDALHFIETLAPHCIYINIHQ